MPNQPNAPKPRTAHMGHLVSDKGDVSPLCAHKPRKVNMASTSRETWTNSADAVTCPQCLAKMNDKSAVAPLNTPKVGKLTTR